MKKHISKDCDKQWPEHHSECVRVWSTVPDVCTFSYVKVFDSVFLAFLSPPSLSFSPQSWQSPFLCLHFTPLIETPVMLSVCVFVYFHLVCLNLTVPSSSHSLLLSPSSTCFVLLLPSIHDCCHPPFLTSYPFVAESQTLLSLFPSLHSYYHFQHNHHLLFFSISLHVLFDFLCLYTLYWWPVFFPSSFSTPASLSLLFSVSLWLTGVFTPQTTSCCWRSMKACSQPPFRPSSLGELPHFKRKWIILWNEWRHVRQWQTHTHTLACTLALQTCRDPHKHIHTICRHLWTRKCQRKETSTHFY